MLGAEQQPMGNRFDPEMVSQLKKEIVNDLKARQEWEKKYYEQQYGEYEGDYAGNRPGPGYYMNYGRPGPGFGRGYRRGPGYGAGMNPGYGAGMGPGYGAGMVPGYGAGMGRSYRAGTGPGYGMGMGPGYGAGMNTGYGAGMGPGYGMGMGPGRYYGWRPWPMPGYRSRRQDDYDWDWWTDREEYDYQRNMAMLRRQLQRELEGMNRANSRLNQVRDPQVRMMLYEVMQEAWRRGMDVPEIMQSLNMDGAQPGLGGSLVDRILGSFRLDRRSFGWGIGTGLLGMFLLPSLSKAMRPLARKAMEEAMEVGERAQGVFARAKEEFEDIVAEANFNKIKDTIVNQTNMPEDKDRPPK